MKPLDELIAIMESVDRGRRRRSLYGYYPENGPLRRELYQKHLSFFRGGVLFRERAAIAANRVGKCVSYRTLINHPDGSVSRAGDLYAAGKPFPVKSWDGKQMVDAVATEGIKKPAEMVYRLWLSNGEWFECAANHRVLTASREYAFVSDLLPYAPCLPVSIAAPGLSIHFSDVQRWLGITPGCQDRCESPVCGGQPQTGADIDQAFSPSQADALQRNAALSCKDGQGHRHTSSSRLADGHPSTPGVALLASDQLNVEGAQAASQFSGQSFCPSQEDAPFQPVECLVNTAQGTSLCRKLAPSLLNPLSNDMLDIVAYNPVGVYDIYDFTVEGHHNYLCAGAIHHNTEGMGGYEITLHLTGDYPDWWEGRRFNQPVDAWAAGTTGLTTRDIIQAKLLGPPEKQSEWGTALIPGDKILHVTMHRGIPNAVESILVRHVSGGVSTINLKSYEQGRKKFEGTSKHIVWFDEEPPLDIYTEGLLRTMDCDGMVMCTFTPLEGISDVVLMFMPGGQVPKATGKLQRFVIFADWNDVPHLTEKAKRELYDSLPPHQRDARSKGIPSLGSGAIYPVAEDQITVPDFILPVHWPRAFAMDVGWKCTAAVWAAIDRESQTAYIYSCYKAGHLEPPIHASAIKTRGAWIPGVGDAAAVSQMDGDKMITIYQGEGLDLELPDKAVEAGIYDVWTALANGSLKVFKSLAPWFDEFRIYRRDENGKIVKENDHLMDCTRYMKRSGLARAVVRPVTIDFDPFQPLLSRPTAMCA